MGQRLVIEIVEAGKPLATKYDKWRGEALTALTNIKSILKVDSSHMDDTSGNRVIKAIRMLETTRATLVDEELNYLIEHYPELEADIKHIETCKNDTSTMTALIFISEEKMRCRNDADVYVKIDLTNKTIKCDLFSKYSEFDYFRITNNRGTYDLTEYDIDFDNLGYESLDLLDEIIRKGKYFKVKGKDRIYIPVSVI